MLRTAPDVDLARHDIPDTDLSEEGYEDIAQAVHIGPYSVVVEVTRTR